MEAILTALSGGFFMYTVTWLFLYKNGKPLIQSRFSRYFKRTDLSEVQDQVLRERLEKAKKAKSQNGRVFGKQLGNILAMSGVKLNAREFIISWVIAALAPVLIVLLFRGNIITAIGLGLMGFAAPPLLVSRSRKKRQDEFNRQLADSIVVMVNCIKAGFSFQQSMESIASEMQPPISTEFVKVLREIQYGVSLQDALNHMVERVKNKDLDLLVSAVLTSAQVGGNLSEILEVIAETIKDRLRIKSEVRVLTSSGRISGMIIGLLPVVIILMLMVINPNYFMEFCKTEIGKIMIVISVILELIGFALINKIVDIQY